MRWFDVFRACATGVLLAAVAREAPAITPDNPGAANVRFTVDSVTNSPKPISPYIYGANGTSLGIPQTLDRMGGNRWSAYNWETNASNAGKDWHYQNDNLLFPHNGPPDPGAGVLETIQAPAAANRAIVVTVPMAGYVAADVNGTQIERSQFAPSSRFREVVATKATKYPGASLSLTPDLSDNYVFTDEFVNRVETGKQPGQQVFYSLDNEPGLWGEALPGNFQSSNWNQPNQPGGTHPEVHPYEPTFQELRDKTIDHAKAIKSVNQNALVFGGVGYGWNDFATLQGAPDMSTHNPVVDYDGNEDSGSNKGELSFYEYLLDSVKREDDALGLTAQGRTLMDVLDLHWYPEARSGTDPDTNPGVRITENDNSAAVAAARVQAPRSLWDPTYSEVSWISKWAVGNGAGAFGQVKLLPRVQQDVNKFKPGTKISITEYNFGGSNHISGGVAQADALGIFGRDGVFAASLWGLSSQQQFTAGAFKMYLDYDGAAGQGEFGDLSIDAATDQISQSSVYASLDSTDPTRMIVVAINRSTTSKTSSIQVKSDLRFTNAEVYQLTSSSSNPSHQADIPISLVNAFLYTMPASSVTTFVLHAASPGDFNNDGSVDMTDLDAWQAGLGTTAGATLGDGDFDGDHDVDGVDFLTWQRGFGKTPSNASAIPEPSGAGLMLSVIAIGVYRRERRRR